MGGNTYTLGQTAGDWLTDYVLWVGSNSTDSVTLQVTNGTIDADAVGATHTGIRLDGTSSLIVSNGGCVLSISSYYGSNTSVIVDGAGSFAELNRSILNATTPGSSGGDSTFDLTVRNGGQGSLKTFVPDASYGTHSGDVLVDGGTLTNNTPLVASGGSIIVTNGGTIYIPAGAVQSLGLISGSGGIVTVGGAPARQRSARKRWCWKDTPSGTSTTST